MVAVRSLESGSGRNARFRTVAEASKKGFGQERALLDHVMQLSNEPEGCIALHLHLSRLGPQLRQADTLKDAVAAFQEFVVANRARLFCLADLDIILIARNAPTDVLERVVTRLRYTFRADPISRPTPGKGDPFCTWYDLETDFQGLYDFARRRADVGDARKREAATRLRLAKSDERHPLTPRQLDHIETTIQRSDIAELIRSQPVCGVRENSPPQPVFDERYVSMDALESLMAPDTRLTESPWLFKHLTGCLDRQMLHRVSKETSPPRAISLNLSVGTVLSTDFARFERHLVPHLSGKLVIELQAVDYFHDPASFCLAREHLRQQGHTLCLDGLTHQTITLIDRRQVGVDLVKLRWSSEFPRAPLDDGAVPGSQSGLRQAITNIGPARLILCRCDGADAVEVGRAMGISLFQGRHIDYLLAVQNTVSEKARRLPTASDDLCDTNAARLSALSPDWHDGKTSLRSVGPGEPATAEAKGAEVFRFKSF